MVSQRVLSTFPRKCPNISLNDRRSCEDVDGKSGFCAFTSSQIMAGPAEAVMKRRLDCNCRITIDESGIKVKFKFSNSDDWMIPVRVCRFRQNDYPQNLIKIFWKFLSRLYSSRGLGS